MKARDLSRDIRLIYGSNFAPLPFLPRARAMTRLAMKMAFNWYDAPISLLIAVTGRCQCACAHCGVPYLGEPRTLDFARICSLMDEYRALGGVRVILSGGEPLLEPDIPELVAHATRLGLTSFVDTNGVLVSDAMAARLAEAGVCTVELSLDYLDPDKMAESRRHKHILDKVHAAIAALRRNGVAFSINTVATRDKLSTEVAAIIRFARSAGASYVRVLEPVATGVLRDQQEVALTPAEMEAYGRFYEPGFVIMEKVGKFTDDCSGLNGRYLAVAPDGTVAPCPYMPIALGNVHDDTLATIIDRTRALANRVKASSECHGCDSGSCPANNPAFRDVFLDKPATQTHGGREQG